MADLKNQVLDALRTVQDPDLHKDLVSLNMIRDLAVTDAGEVSVTVVLTTPACPMKEKIRSDCERAIHSVPGVTSSSINITSETTRGAVGADKAPIDGVRNIIAVGSGKGGVGKSTTAVNLAIALQRSGARVALLDADIYGPNVPGMLGVRDRPKVLNNKIVPLEAHGIHMVSMGLLVAEEQPLVWRGPMLHGVMKQLLRDVAWGQQDYLVIDLPPGTGDVQLSLSQMVPVTGAVIVTTPQNVALQDVRKGIAMFRQVNIPIAGIVENMAYYLCPKCGNRDEIFAAGGGRGTADDLDVPFLGEIPLNSDIRRAMDAGRPIAADPESRFHDVYRAIAEKIAQSISIINAGAGPRPFAVING